jgi:hypothetical protein
VEAVLVDGSFVTAKIDPNDIDLILIVPEVHDFSADISLAEYNVVSSAACIGGTVSTCWSPGPTRKNTGATSVSFSRCVSNRRKRKAY